MTSREVMTRTIEFNCPGRLALRFPSYGTDDVFGVGWTLPEQWKERQKKGYDEWGCKWEKSDVDNIGQIKGHPLKNWSDLKNLKVPDCTQESMYAGWDEQIAEGKRQGKYTMSGVFMLLFERMWALRGFQQLLEDLYLHPKECEALADIIVEEKIRIFRAMGKYSNHQINGVEFTEDWGSNTGTLIHPDKWREFFKPRYKKIFDAMHQEGMHVWMHCDGKINDILEDLIEIGLDVINLQQPNVNGIEEVGRRFKGRVAIWGSCDIQSTLPKGTLKDIRDEAREILDNFSTPEGGYILQDYGDDTGIGSTEEKKRAMYDAFMEYSKGRFKTPDSCDS